MANLVPIEIRLKFSTPPNKNQSQFGKQQHSGGSANKKFLNSDEKRGVERFRRIKEENVTIDDRLRDNSYDAKKQFISFARDVDYEEEDEGKVDLVAGAWRCLVCKATNPDNRNCSECGTFKVLATSKSKLKNSWACSECDTINFWDVATCAECSLEKPNKDATNTIQHPGRRPGDWSCSDCQVYNYSKRENCFKCGKENTNEDGCWTCEGCNNKNYGHYINARGSFGEKANEILKHTRGKSFRHEKTKKKRSGYRGGFIDKSDSPDDIVPLPVQPTTSRSIQTLPESVAVTLPQPVSPLKPLKSDSFWVCLECKAYNARNRRVCLACGNRKSLVSRPIRYKRSWLCRLCARLNLASEVECKHCGAPGNVTAFKDGTCEESMFC
ncbi:hypothetical protein quinque_003426 [Culex quinquefasciatus]